jgi:DNA-binding beta-propeller fold protein YncE
VGKGTFWLAVSDATDTVYAPAFGVPAFTGDTVSVINGAACSGTDHSGCGRPAATVSVGAAPFGIAVNDQTHTVYVANNTDGLAPGTVSMINEATCNGANTVGCGNRMPAFVVGRSPLTVAVSAPTNTVYVADFSSAEVSVINGARCNATHPRSCRSAVREQATGSQPGEAAAGTINTRSATLYIPLSFPNPNGALAIIKIKR